MVLQDLKDIIIKETGISDVEISTPENLGHGDYTTNIALKSGRGRTFADDLIAKLKSNKKLQHSISRIEIAGPGFINFWISDTALTENLQNVLEKGENYGSSKLGKGKSVLVEYSAPNIAKRFGVGHLRSTIIGQALYNLYKFLGYKVVGENHLGDWGTQFGSIIAELKAKGLKADGLTITDLEKHYVEFNAKAKDNPELWDEAREWFKKLENGDKEARQIWQKVKEISLSEFERIYSLLGVNIENAHGESFYEDKMEAVIKEIRDKGLSKLSEGAEIVEFEGMPPAMLVKSDKTTTYFTRDLAAARYRIQTWNPDLLIYEVGSDQILHLRQVFAAIKLLGWEKKQKFVHVAHGLVRFKDGKMSTRKGKTVNLEEILDEAVKRAKKWNDSEGIAKDVGVSAIKYFDLLHNPTSEIIFDWGRIFLLEGNSGPYLQYTFARTNSVLNKAADQLPHQLTSSLVHKFTSEESSILRTLIHFSEIIQSAALAYSPNLLCNYLFDLAQKFNTLYNSEKIIGSDREELRLALTKATGQVLKNGLTILGLKTPDRM